MNSEYQIKLLLLADTSTPEALGSKLVNSTKYFNLNPSVSYNSAASSFSPSMAALPGKIFYRLADRRSWEWWNYQKQLIKQITALKPQLVLVTGIFPLKESVFKAVDAYGGKIVNWLTDDPWNPIHKRKSFIVNLPYYDHIFSTKVALQQRLHSVGVSSTSWLPFAYDSTLHYPPLPLDIGDQDLFSSDITFVGTGAPERLPWLNAAQSAADSIGFNKCRIYGASWQQLSTPGWQREKIVRGINYCKALFHARVVLGLLRASNHDKSTDRSYEIGAIGACGLMQDTDEHRALLPNYPDEGFFLNPQQLAQRCKILLRDDDLCAELRKLGRISLQSDQHTYKFRMQNILEWWASHK